MANKETTAAWKAVKTVFVIALYIMAVSIAFAMMNLPSTFLMIAGVALFIGTCVHGIGRIIRKAKEYISKG